MKIVNRRNIILIIGLILSLLAYIYTDADFAPYLVVLFLLLFMGAALCVLLTGRDISFKVSGQIQGTRGNPAAARIKVFNGSIVPAIMCNAEVLVRNILTGESETEKHCFCIRGRGAKTIDIKVKPKYCGCIRIEPVRMSISDPFRLFERKIDAKAGEGGKMNIYYLPEAVETFISPEEVSAYNMESYKYSSLSKGGDPAETFDIKNYERGDNFKAIHWKLSSKTDEIVIREYGLPIENNVLILVDKRREHISPEQADRETEFTASLSYTLLKKEVNHTVGWFNIDTDSFETGRVDSTDSFWKAMRGLVSSPFGPDRMSVVDRFIESETGKDYSAYVFVSPEGADIEKLMAYGQVDLYRPEDFR